jgi:hypothetical protein
VDLGLHDPWPLPEPLGPFPGAGAVVAYMSVRDRYAEFPQDCFCLVLVDVHVDSSLGEDIEVKAFSTLTCARSERKLSCLMRPIYAAIKRSSTFGYYQLSNYIYAVKTNLVYEKYLDISHVMQLM